LDYCENYRKKERWILNLTRTKKIDNLEKILHLALFFIVYWFINLGVHEMGHYYSASLLGHSASAHFALAHAWTEIPFTFGTVDALIIGLSGGMFAFAVWLILSWLTTSYLRDVSLGFFAVYNFVYGIMEGLWGYGWVSTKTFQVMPAIFATIIFVWMLYMNRDFHFFGKKRINF